MRIHYIRNNPLYKRGLLTFAGCFAIWLMIWEVIMYSSKATDYKILLKRERTRFNITQAELAEYMGISLHTYRRIETGKRPPYKYEAQELAQELCIDFEPFWKLCERAWDNLIC